MINLNNEKSDSIRPTRTSLHLKKALGQHFLRDRDAAARIASYLPKDKLIVEIGPGDGALTQELFQRGNRVLAIEIDAEMIPVLKRRFHRQKETFQLMVADALRVDWEKLSEDSEPYALTGNLPYNIASQLIMRIFNAVRHAEQPFVSEMIVMVQKEVAERLTASPGNKSYGALTILTDYHAESEYLFTIPNFDFFPKPLVDGGVIRLTIKKKNEVPKVDYVTLRRVVKGCFAQRRKVLSNSIRVVNGLPSAWREISIDWMRRPEQLEPEEFYALTNELMKMGLGSTELDSNENHEQFPEE